MKLGAAGNRYKITRVPMNRIIFECPTCHQAITRELLPLPSDQRVCLDDEKPAVPPGFFAISDDNYWTDSDGCPLVNLADIINTRHYPGRLGGCCGPDGRSGPNLLCSSGHEIGTERSDCWMAHAAVLLRDLPIRSVEA